MREIKFRFWNDPVKRYHYGPNQVMELLKQQVAGIYNHEKDGCFLEQYTGLKDKNGREIYEGDIWKRGEHIAKVVWDMCGWDFETLPQSPCISYPYFHSNARYGEVIGNIHENAELLNAKS